MKVHLQRDKQARHAADEDRQAANQRDLLATTDFPIIGAINDIELNPQFHGERSQADRNQTGHEQGDRRLGREQFLDLLIQERTDSTSQVSR